jgi:hypothetical protein
MCRKALLLSCRVPVFNAEADVEPLDQQADAVLQLGVYGLARDVRPAAALRSWLL